jgi:hypothetical protein
MRGIFQILKVYLLMKLWSTFNLCCYTFVSVEFVLCDVKLEDGDYQEDPCAATDPLNKVPFN